MSNWLHSVELQVRDSDIDFQGIVGNHMYQAYFSHGSSRMVKMLGYDIMRLHEQGIDCIIVQVVIDYKNTITNGDTVIVNSNLEFKGQFQTLFLQELVRKSDGVVCATAKYVGCVITKDGPIEPSVLREARDQYLAGLSQDT